MYHLRHSVCGWVCHQQSAIINPVRIRAIFFLTKIIGPYSLFNSEWIFEYKKNENGQLLILSWRRKKKLYFVGIFNHRCFLGFKIFHTIDDNVIESNWERKITETIKTYWQGIVEFTYSNRLILMVISSSLASSFFLL